MCEMYACDAQVTWRNTQKKVSQFTFCNGTDGATHTRRIRWNCVCVSDAVTGVCACITTSLEHILKWAPYQKPQFQKTNVYALHRNTGYTCLFTNSYTSVQSLDWLDSTSCITLNDRELGGIHRKSYPIIFQWDSLHLRCFAHIVYIHSVW